MGKSNMMINIYNIYNTPTRHLFQSQIISTQTQGGRKLFASLERQKKIFHFPWIKFQNITKCYPDMEI